MPGANTAKQLRLLIALWLILLLVVFAPSLRLGFSAFRSREIQVGSARITVPAGWLVHVDDERVTLSKPCYTVFCKTARAGFMVERSKSAEAEGLWIVAAKKTLPKLWPDASFNTINKGPGLECLESEVISADGRVMSTCLNSALHLSSTFRGEPSLRPTFYDVMISAH